MAPSYSGPKFVISSFFCLLLSSPLAKGSPLVENVEGVVGGDLVLPCDVEPPIDDRVAVILWYRDNHPDAMYTYDARNTSLGYQQHTPRDQRTHFHPKKPARLIISKATLEDAGRYECRVDFMRAPSKTTIVEVRVVQPPSTIKISLPTGKVLTLSVTANEGSRLHLSCIVKGGHPQPNVWWTLNNRTHEHVVDETWEEVDRVTIQNDLIITRLTPAYHLSRIACHAGHNRNAALSRRITLLLNMAPQSVKITGLTMPLQAGNRYRAWCETFGSRPAPTLTWSLKKVDHLESVLDTQELMKSNVSRSSIDIDVDFGDHGALLKCKAFSPELTDRIVTNTSILDVNCDRPRLRLVLGQMLQHDGIQELMDVYFHCSVTANPKVYKVTWFHNDVEVRPDKAGGVIVASDHLVLQRISRKWSGNYVCKASNVVGDATSNKLQIKVKYAPICSTSTTAVYRAALGEEITLPCRVLAYPPNVTFSWTFMNALTEHERVPGERVSWNGLESRLRYLPEKTQDYGTLHCWGSNAVGNQAKPCIFTVKPAGVPSAPLNCTVSNQTWESVEVTCGDPSAHMGPDGRGIGPGGHYPGSHGHYNSTNQESNDIVVPNDQAELLQDSDKPRYLLTVHERGGHTVVHNVTGDRGIFSVPGLTPGLDYVISVRRFNSHGRSPPVTLEAFTLRTAENRMREEEDATDSAVLGVIVGVMGVVVVLAAGAIILSLRSRSRPHHHNPPHPSEATRLPPGGGGGGGEAASDSGGLDHPDLLEAESHVVPSTAYRAAEVTQALLSTSRPIEEEMMSTLSPSASVSPTAHLEYLSCEGPESISPTLRPHARLYVRAEGHTGQQESFL
ncbi:LOW QUALITY PROTEIN: neural cell adhesion molecule 1-like [Macrobrachium rosenbergii]|uniref:LOW QUALITY PROTEIN: neural cell adhesion molecule 1-like n=1 Tax=Macrobrachium rosenbergii TaxID=79674 RepID=UPI0034D4F19A